MFVFRRLICCTLATLALVVASCSNRDELSGAEATGKVTLDGKPFTAGTVLFIGSNGLTGADIQSDGSYHATNVPLGQVRVVIGATGAAPRATGSTSMSANRGQPPQAPIRYRNADTSGLTLTVSGGSNPYDIAMTAR